ncbi:MAG: 16S rRNA (cytidine(1402)-2'-O)-methyltransferase [Thermoleophilia bacterium]|nr:16S rRNA (cytidine(1402)-2'-O)-methyltransferase [Thermoleophilia bacterium]
MGNLGDVSKRLVEVLGSVHAIACEDTRRTRKLLSAIGVPAPRLLSYRLDNEHASAAGLVPLLLGGSDIALVSDAGTPAIADPGVALVRAAHAAGVEVVAVPGPSAVIAALSVSGFGASCHTFVGFLPRSAREITALVAQYSSQVLVAFESPRRVAATLATVAEVQPARAVAVVREITKLHEQTYLGSVREVADQLLALDGVLGEIVTVFDALAEAEAVVDERALRLVTRLVEAGVRMKDACAIVAEHESLSKRELYDAMIAASRDS